LGACGRLQVRSEERCFEPVRRGPKRSRCGRGTTLKETVGSGCSRRWSSKDLCGRDQTRGKVSWKGPSRRPQLGAGTGGGVVLQTQIEGAAPERGASLEARRRALPSTTARPRDVDQQRAGLVKARAAGVDILVWRQRAAVWDRFFAKRGLRVAPPPRSGQVGKNGSSAGAGSARASGGREGDAAFGSAAPFPQHPPIRRRRGDSRSCSPNTSTVRRDATERRVATPHEPRTGQDAQLASSARHFASLLTPPRQLPGSSSGSADASVRQVQAGSMN